MHRTPLSGTQRRTRRAGSRSSLRTRALKNGLAGHGSSGRGTHCAGGRSSVCSRTHRARRRSFIHRTRPCLRHDHAGCGRLGWSSNYWRRCWARCGRRKLWQRRSGDCGSRWRRRWRHDHRRHGRRRYRLSLRSGRSSNRGRDRWCWRNDWGGRFFCRRSNHCRPRYNRSRRYYGSLDRRRCRGWLGWWRSCDYRLGYNRRRDWADRSGGGFLLLGDGLQHVARAGDVRQVDLGLDFFFAAQKARGLGGRRRSFRPAAEVGPHFFRFVLLQRTGMGFLLRHSDER